MLSATNTEPAPTKDTTCVELIGAAKRATTAEPEALETLEDDKDECTLCALLQNDSQGASTQSRHCCKMTWQGKHVVKALLLQGDMSKHVHRCNMAPRDNLTDDMHGLREGARVWAHHGTKRQPDR